MSDYDRWRRQQQFWIARWRGYFMTGWVSTFVICIAAAGAVIALLIGIWSLEQHGLPALIFWAIISLVMASIFIGSE